MITPVSTYIYHYFFEIVLCLLSYISAIVDFSSGFIIIIKCIYIYIQDKYIIIIIIDDGTRSYKTE